MSYPTPNEEQLNIVIEENKNKLRQIVDFLSQHPAKAFFSFTIENLKKLIEDPFDLSTVLYTLSVEDSDVYWNKFREKYEILIKKGSISLDFKLAMSNVIRRWAQDVGEWAENLREPTNAKTVSQNFNNFLEEKGWCGIPRLLVLGRTGPYNNPKDELDRYSKVPEEIELARRLWLERREEGQRNGPFLQAFIESIPRLGSLR